MDLLIQNATLEEITTICSRVATPSIDEALDDERLLSVSKYINQGDSPEEAKAKYQQEIKDKAEAVINETKSSELHLDGPPPQDDVTLEEVIKLASEVAKSGKMEFIRELVTRYGVKKIKELKTEDLPQVYSELKEALNG